MEIPIRALEDVKASHMVVSSVLIDKRAPLISINHSSVFLDNSYSLLLVTMGFWFLLRFLATISNDNSCDRMPFIATRGVIISIYICMNMTSLFINEQRTRTVITALSVVFRV